MPPYNRVFVIVLDSLGTAFEAAVKDAFFVVSVKQKREFCWKFSTFSSTLEEKGEMLLERPVFSFFQNLLCRCFTIKSFCVAAGLRNPVSAGHGAGETCGCRR